jgi:hypothetical protein
MTQALSVTASFTPTYTLTVTKTGTGTGTVTSSPPGIDCGGTCSASFNSGTNVTLMAAPASGCTFAGWSGGGCGETGTCIVSMTQPRNLVATFQDPTPPNTSITSGPSGAITVSSASFTWTGSDNLTPTGSLVYAYRLDPLEPSFSAFSSATSKTYTGLASRTYTFYAKARDQVGNEDPTPASRSFAVDTAPPTITYTPVTSWRVNAALPITATIADNIGVQSATLFYRKTGTPGYPSVPMTASGPTYRGTIPASAMTEAGVQYYLEATDAAGNIQRVPSTAPEIPYSVVVGTSVFTDDPLSARTTPIKAVHFTELRTAINALWTKYSVPGVFPDWSGPAPAPRGAVRAAHLTDLRTALDQAYTKAGKTHTPYTNPTITPGSTPIKVNHLSELRTFVRNLE